MRFLLLAAAVGSLAFACGGGSGEGPDYVLAPGADTDVKSAEPEPGAPDDDGDYARPSEDGPVVVPDPAPSADTDAGAPPPDPTPAAGPVAYSGTLGSSAVKSFSYTCSYTVAMTNVRVVVTVDKGEVVDANVKADMVEKVVGSCARPSIPTNTHEHAFDKNAAPARVPTSGAVSIPMFRKGGTPTTTLSLNVARKMTGGFDASLTWKRVDDVPTSLRWTVSAKVVIQKK
jgi:hypothetical protein